MLAKLTVNGLEQQIIVVLEHILTQHHVPDNQFYTYMEFKLSNAGDREINDDRIKHVFPVEGYCYTFKIKPKCLYWRFGLRFSPDSRGISGYSSSYRYNNTQLKHLEICAGVRSPEWKDPNLLQLQEYFITEKGSTYYSSSNYNEGADVLMTIKPLGYGKMLVTMACGPLYHEEEVNIGFSKTFEVFGWADFMDFLIEGEIIPQLIPIIVTVDPVKAITNQETKLLLGNLSIFFGANNSGKSSLLIGAVNSSFITINNSHDYLGLNRIHTESEYDFKLETGRDYIRSRTQRGNRLKRTDATSNQNAPFDWIVELALQDESTREKILTWMKKHFEEWTFDEVREGKYTTNVHARVNGYEPNFQGTGARAALPIIIQLYNPEVTILAIDEPELGLEPRMQKILFNAICDATQGANDFPLKRVLLATHSHLFLDRINIDNNFHVSKKSGSVNVEQVTDIRQLQDSTYSMLGASPSDLFFPGNVVVVEGKTDYLFIKRIYEIGYANGLFKNQLAFHYMEGYNKLPHTTDAIVQMLKTQAYIPVYQDKICGLIDHPEDSSVLLKTRAFFKDETKERFVALDKKAIEYYYPLDCIKTVFEIDVDIATYNEAVEAYLASVLKSKPYTGKIFNKALTKVEFVKSITEVLTFESIINQDNQIINLLKKADSMAFS